MQTDSEKIAALVEWFDDYRPEITADLAAALWCAKVQEEAGEVAEALVGVLDFNPRKGKTHALGDVTKELLDVAVTALCAVQEISGGDVMAKLSVHIQRAESRIGTRVEGK